MQKIKKQTKLFVATVLASALVFVFAASFVSPVAAAECDGVDTAIISCEKNDAEGAEGTAVWRLLIMVINILTAGIGVLALAGIVYGSILYTSAGGSPEQVKKAMGIIQNVIIGVVAYAGMYALLQFLIPGGVF